MAHSAEKANHWISFVLRWGSRLAAGAMAIGVVAVVATAGGTALQVGPPVPLKVMLTQLVHRDPYAIIQVGILLLLLTPLVRLATAVVSFWMEKEKRYALVSLIVLTIIIGSVILARAG